MNLGDFFKMRVLFVNPPNTTAFHVTEPSKYVEENVGINYFIIPRTPFQVVASIPNNPKIQKDIILLDYEWYKKPSLTKEQLVDKVLERNPDVVLTTLISTSNADSVDYLTTQIRKNSPRTKIIVGGQGVETLREKTFSFVPNIDAALLNGSEGVMELTLESVVNGYSMADIPEIVFREGKEIISNPAQNGTETIHSQEKMYGQFRKPLNEIVRTVIGRGATPIGILENYKGCPFPCNFCAAKKPVAKRNINSTLEELAYLYDTGIPRFYFVDLNFGLSEKDTSELLIELGKFKSEHQEFGFRCVTRANIIDKALAQKMKRAGCYEVGIGVETGDDSVLKVMNKKSSKEINWRAMDALGREGITFKLFLIEGYNGSSSKSSAETFSLLNQIRDKGYSYFVQPALSRDIMPHQEGFRIREESGVLRRGTMHQLDFRHDGRDFGWDSDRAIRSMCYLMLAYPSTEISQTRSDQSLQQRAVMDLPFLVQRSAFSSALNLATNEVQRDTIHYLDGIYTPNEIKLKIEKLYGDLATGLEVEKIIEEFRGTGLVDSLGRPNIKAEFLERKEDIERGDNRPPQTSRDLLLFWNGQDQRYAYLPKGVKNMKASFYQDIPEDAFEFLSLSKGVYSLEDISGKMFKLFGRRNGYSSSREAEQTTKTIRNIYQEAGFLTR